ncbi:hypothetical protein [Arcobacter sp. LA11]|uniref:hypothetical protein n=1 Tax=Arcobacter sp. LA11 TaxID=1898176 RepID=UPI0009335A29|nr:hypothetical protein [Arcobacter sp. LA11]
MTTDTIAIIEKKIEELINDKTEYNFLTLKEKVEKILKNVDIFFIENELNTKAVDMYLKNVITQRNNIKKEQEKTKIDNSKETKYILIESICKKCQFQSQEELIKKIDELEKKTNFELNEINNSL